VKSLKFVLLSIFLFSLVACTTYQFPSPINISEEQLVGRYHLEVPEEFLILDIYLYPDGYFLESALYTDNNEHFSDVGSYTFDESSHEISFFYPGSTHKYNYKAKVSSDFSYFTESNENYQKYEIIEDQYSIKEVSNEFLLEYNYDEITIISLILNTNGSFLEILAYPESDEIYINRGSFHLSSISGCIYFEYDDWPEGNFYGKYDRQTNMLYTVEGDYSISTSRRKK